MWESPHKYDVEDHKQYQVEQNHIGIGHLILNRSDVSTVNGCFKNPARLQKRPSTLTPVVHPGSNGITRAEKKDRFVVIPVHSIREGQDYSPVRK
jgi:hypothetical protein